MAEMLYPKRVIFLKGKQRKFLLEAIQKINISWALLAEKANFNRRTLNDWRREQYSMSLDGVKKICIITGLKMPADIRIKNSFWYVYKGAKLGAMTTLKKYGRIGGDPNYRKQKWYEWWNKKGQYQKIGCIKGPLPIKTPGFSKNLAEFTGIVLGDGGISNSQIVVSTNSVTDRQYGHFVKRLIRKIFEVEPAVYYRKNQSLMNIVVSRKKLVEFCNKKLGLKIGNKLKQGLDIPYWIKNNPEFEKACIRGLMDTDGCIFNECHKIKNKLYNYKRLNIVSASPELRKSIYDILDKFNLFPKIRNNRCVQVENKEKIIEYFRIIGTNNFKHKKRFYGGVG